MKLDGVYRRESEIYVKEEDLYLFYRMRQRTDADGRICYDLEIAQRCGKEESECRLCDVATSCSMAERIWELFVKGLVTPETAQDILEELLSDVCFVWGFA